MAVLHVPFERKFALSSEKWSNDSDYRSIYGGTEDRALCWSDLHKSTCVVVLGEGKCGKTHEFKQQHQAIRSNICCKAPLNTFVF